MCNRVWNLVILGVAMGLASCQGNGSPTGAHDCLSIWGADADALIVKLQARRAHDGFGWARQISSGGTFQAMVNLKNCLEDGLNQSVVAPTIDSPAGIGDTGVNADIGQILTYSGYVKTGLENCKASGAHQNTTSPGWLPIVAPDGSVQNGVAVAKATQLLTLLKDALDM